MTKGTRAIISGVVSNVALADVRGEGALVELASIPLFVLARSLIAGKEPAAEVFRTPAAVVKCFYRN
ncbi:hypothetical protein VSR82_37520 [Burkholderia sp. JPY481]|uniref:hypothetical protein n=1 Tax=Paraburkholderia sp. JPY465 TaxID=3042285 RepID=UPI00317E6724